MKWFLAILALVSFHIGAEDYEIAPKTRDQKSLALQAPSTIVINSTGLLRISEASGDEIEVLVNNDSNRKVKLTLVEVAPGKVKIEAEVVGGGKAKVGSISNVSIGDTKVNIGGSNFVITGGKGVKISNIRGGNVSIINGRVIVDGQEVTPDGDDSEVQIGDLKLEVKIPARLFQHLQASTDSDLGIQGKFESDLADQRIVVLATSQGAVECVGLCARGNMELKSRQGDVSVKGTVGKVTASTGQGNIVYEINEGDADLSTRMGNVNAYDNKGNMKAHTSMGNVKVRGQENGTVVGETKMGNVHFDNPKALSEQGKSAMGDVKYTPKAKVCESSTDSKPAGKGPFDF